METGNGEIPRGAVIYRKATGLWAPAATAQISTATYLAVLNEDVDTGASASTDVYEAAAYRAGRFINGKVSYLNDTEYEAVTDAHKIVLRLNGIVFNPIDE
jgi:hypothetical protein